MTFNDPLTFGACESRLRHENRAAVDQRAAIADADHAAPRALADQRSQPRFAKHRRENIAVRSRVLVQERRHRSDESPSRICGRLIEGPRIVEREHLSAQPLDQHLRDIAAAVRAHVDDEALFSNLAVVPFYELADARRAHVGNVNVADTAARHLRNLFAVRDHPVEVNQIALIGDRTIRHGPGARHRRLLVDRQLHRAVGFVF